MYPYIHITLPSYGVLAALGAFAVLVFLFFRLDKFSLPFSDYLKMFCLCLLYGAIGSRLLFIVSRIPWLILNFSLRDLLSTVLGGGFVFYGGLFGVLYGVFRYSKKHNLNKKLVYQFISPAIPLFHSIGRIGCFLAGCCHGFQLSTEISVLGLFHIDKFPTQIVESIFEFFLFIFLVLYERKKDHTNGISIYLLTYAIFRFVIEFIRGDAIRGVFLGISTSQIISLGIIVYYCAIAILRKRQKQSLKKKQLTEIPANESNP